MITGIASHVERRDKNTNLYQCYARQEPIRKDVMMANSKDNTEKVYLNGAKYEAVGPCALCGETVYKCVTHPVRDEGMDKSFVAAFVVQGSAKSDEPPALYCQKCDPTKKMRKAGKPANEPMSGDSWSPLR